MAKKRSKASIIVEQLLVNHPRTRNSDKDLIIGALQLKGANLTEQQREIIRSLNFESITRARRKFQESGRYLPTDPDVARQRRFKSYAIQQRIHGTPAEKIVDLIEES